jgi:hypothetical protein
MLPGRLLNSQREFAEALSVVNADDEEVDVVSGDSCLVDLERAIGGQDGLATRSQPGPWVRPIAQASRVESVYGAGV